MEKEPGDLNSKKKLQNDEDDLVLQEADLAQAAGDGAHEGPPLAGPATKAMTEGTL